MHPYLMSAPGMQRRLQQGRMLSRFQDLEVRSRDLALRVNAHSAFAPIRLVPKQAVLDRSRLGWPSALSDERIFFLNRSFSECRLHFF